MRILELISSAGHYGAENMLLTLSESLEKIGCEVRIGVFHNAHKPNVETASHARQRGLVTELIPCEGRADTAAVRAIQNLIHTQQIDLVHTHGYKADLYGFFAARKSAVPILATCHNWPDKNLSLWGYSVLDRLFLRKFPRVAAVSEDVIEALKRLGVRRDRISLIPNGIDLLRFSGSLPTLDAEIPCRGRSVVGMVGRLVPAKRGCDFLDAAAGVLKDFPDALFVLVGEGPDRKNLELRAHRLGIQKSVFFLGRRDDLPGIYASLDALVQPSLTEGMPLTILEAMASRRAVVATPVGAVPQLIRPEQTGLLVQPKDVGGLKAAITRVLADRELRRKLGENAHNLIHDEFSAEIMAKRYLVLFEGLLSRGPLHDERQYEVQRVQ